MYFRDTVDRLLFLRKVPEFEKLPPGPLSALAQAMHERRVPGGTILAESSDGPHTDLVVGVEGKLALTFREKPVWTPDQPHAVNFLLIFGPTREMAVRAEERATVLLLPTVALLNVLEDSFEVAELLLRERATFLASGGLHRFAMRVEENEDDDVALPTEDDPVSRIMALRAISPIRDMELDAIANIARVAKRREYETGDVIWRAGDPSDRVLLILSGRLSLHDDARDETVWFGAGASVGLSSVLSQRARGFEARVGEKLLVLELSEEDLLDVLEDHSESAQRLLAFFASWTLRTLVSRSKETAPLGHLARAGESLSGAPGAPDDDVSRPSAVGAA